MRDTEAAGRRGRRAALAVMVWGALAACQTPVVETPKGQGQSNEDKPQMTAFDITSPVREKGIFTNQRVTVIVPLDTDLTKMTAKAEVTDGAVVEPSPLAEADYSQFKDFIVLSADGTENVYTVGVRYQQPGDNYIKTFQISGLPDTNIEIEHGEETASAGHIHLKLFNGSNLKAVTPFITHTGKTIAPESGTPQDLSGGRSVEYTVTAWNGATRTYTVTAEVVKSALKRITSWRTIAPDAARGTIDEETKTVTVILPYDAELGAGHPIVSEVFHTGASIEPNPQTPRDYDTDPSKNVFTVRAEDGSTETYTARMLISADIARFNLVTSADNAVVSTGIIERGTEEEPNTGAITLYVPKGTDMGDLKADCVLSGEGAAISPDPKNVSGYAAPVDFTVSGPPPQETKTYRVSVKDIPVGQYVIYYDANGGKGTMPPGLATKGETAFAEPNAFTRRGYTFAGNWTTEPEPSGGNSYDANNHYTLLTAGAAENSVTLYARWTPVEYTVVYDLNGGSATPPPSEKWTYDAPKSVAGADGFSKTGHDYTAWNTRKDGAGTVYEAGAAYSNLTDAAGATVTLYAQWKPVTYTVSYDANKPENAHDDDVSGEVADTTHTYGEWGLLSAQVFTVKGYAFNKWATQAGGEGTYAAGQNVRNLSDAAGTITLYAQWKPKMYYVTYHRNTSKTDTTEINDATKFTYGGESQTLTSIGNGGLNWASAKPGHTFAGWATGADGAKAFNDEAAITTEFDPDGMYVDLYAVWQPNTYTVTYHKNPNKDGTGDQQTTAHGADFVYGVSQNLKTIAELGWDADSIKPGYIFRGWAKSGESTDADFSEGEAIVTQFTKEANNAAITLYAVWKAKQFTVVFHKNIQNDDATFTQHDFVYDTEKLLAAFGNRSWEPEEGYEFKGWAREASAADKEFDDNAKITNQINPPADNATVHLYAVWGASGGA